MPNSASLNTQSRIFKRISCVQRFKHKKFCSYRAAERTGKHGHGYANRWVGRATVEKSIQDRPRTGRPSKLTELNISFIKRLVEADSKVGSAEVARKLGSEIGVSVTAKTVRNALKNIGFKYSSSRKILQHSVVQRSNRVKWCKHIRNTQRLSFQKVMFTDSKLFTLHPSAATCSAQRWHATGKRPTVAPARHSKGVHVYMGATAFGVTSFVFVTGGGTKLSTYWNPKAKSVYRGVCAEEYQKEVLPILLQEGKRLFKGTRWAHSWILQQDNARPHVDAGTLGLLEQEMPGRLLHWPSASPDLSWIENLWAWMEKELRKQSSHFKTAEELRSALLDVHKRIPHVHLVNYVKGMRRRLLRCIDMQGGMI